MSELGMCRLRTRGEELGNKLNSKNDYQLASYIYYLYSLVVSFYHNYKNYCCLMWLALATKELHVGIHQLGFVSMLNYRQASCRMAMAMACTHNTFMCLQIVRHNNVQLYTSTTCHTLCNYNIYNNYNNIIIWTKCRLQVGLDFNFV